MNKSLEYIKQRITDNNMVFGFNLNDIDNLHVNTMYDVYGYDLPFDNPQPILMNYDGSILAEIVYNPNANYDYFTMETCFCDGTLAFMNELMLKNIQKIMELKTAYSPAIEKIGAANLPDYKIIYEVGDFVCSIKNSESPDPERPWVCSKFTAYLPIKFTLTKLGTWRSKDVF